MANPNAPISVRPNKKIGQKVATPAGQRTRTAGTSDSQSKAASRNMEPGQVRPAPATGKPRQQTQSDTNAPAPNPKPAPNPYAARNRRIKAYSKFLQKALNRSPRPIKPIEPAPKPKGAGVLPVPGTKESPLPVPTAGQQGKPVARPAKPLDVPGSKEAPLDVPERGRGTAVPGQPDPGPIQPREEGESWVGPKGHRFTQEGGKLKYQPTEATPVLPPRLVNGKTLAPLPDRIAKGEHDTLTPDELHAAAKAIVGNNGRVRVTLPPVSRLAGAWSALSGGNKRATKGDTFDITDGQSLHQFLQKGGKLEQEHLDKLEPLRSSTRQLNGPARPDTSRAKPQSPVDLIARKKYDKISDRDYEDAAQLLRKARGRHARLQIKDGTFKIIRDGNDLRAALQAGAIPSQLQMSQLEPLHDRFHSEFADQKKANETRRAEQQARQAANDAEPQPAFDRVDGTKPTAPIPKASDSSSPNAQGSSSASKQPLNARSIPVHPSWGLSPEAIEEMHSISDETDRVNAAGLTDGHPEVEAVKQRFAKWKKSIADSGAESALNGKTNPSSPNVPGTGLHPDHAQAAAQALIGDQGSIRLYDPSGRPHDITDGASFQKYLGAGGQLKDDAHRQAVRAAIHAHDLSKAQPVAPKIVTESARTGRPIVPEHFKPAADTLPVSKPDHVKLLQNARDWAHAEAINGGRAERLAAHLKIPLEQAHDILTNAILGVAVHAAKKPLGEPATATAGVKITGNGRTASLNLPQTHAAREMVRNLSEHMMAGHELSQPQVADFAHSLQNHLQPHEVERVANTLRSALTKEQSDHVKQILKYAAQGAAPNTAQGV